MWTRNNYAIDLSLCKKCGVVNGIGELAKIEKYEKEKKARIKKEINKLKEKL